MGEWLGGRSRDSGGLLPTCGQNPCAVTCAVPFSWWPLGPNKLDTIFWALGIESPKEEMDGSMVYGVPEGQGLILKYRKDW